MMPHNSPCAPAAGDIATAGMLVSVFSQCASWSISSNAPWTVETGLPGLSEPQVVRHYTKLSQKNYAIDMGVYPLGSCTMKHNPRLNEKLARLPGFADVHPLQPVSTVQGALELIDTLAHWLKTLTGLPAVALSPAAGAHGELCGIMTIRAALEARGDPRAAHSPREGDQQHLHQFRPVRAGVQHPSDAARRGRPYQARRAQPCHGVTPR